MTLLPALSPSSSQLWLDRFIPAASMLLCISVTPSVIAVETGAGLTISTVRAPAEARPDLQLAGVYRDGLDLSEYWISEKLDGARAYWDGRNLRSRAGHVFHAPDWFFRGFPSQPLDGELWMGRGGFEHLMSTVRDKVPDEAAWRQVQYRVFDLPGSSLPYSGRYRILTHRVGDGASRYLKLVQQYRLNTENELMADLSRVTQAGGEGLMLRREASPYVAGRGADLLKLKPYQDAEARVLAHLPGRGKYEGMLGSLLVETPQGIRFRIGTGFSNAQRRNPPLPGSTITYKYQGKTERGVPRFASFLRESGMQ